MLGLFLGKVSSHLQTLPSGNEWHSMERIAATDIEKWVHHDKENTKTKTQNVFRTSCSSRAPQQCHYMTRSTTLLIIVPVYLSVSHWSRNKIYSCQFCYKVVTATFLFHTAPQTSSITCWHLLFHLCILSLSLNFFSQLNKHNVIHPML